jgi:hypothetical protein
VNISNLLFNVWKVDEVSDHRERERVDKHRWCCALLVDLICRVVAVFSFTGEAELKDKNWKDSVFLFVLLS